MICGTTCHNMNTGKLPDFFIGHTELFNLHIAILHMLFKGLTDCSGLIVDLL